MDAVFVSLDMTLIAHSHVYSLLCDQRNRDKQAGQLSRKVSCWLVCNKIVQYLVCWKQ